MTTRRRRLFLAVAAGLLTALLAGAGCGNKGPLYLPDRDEAPRRS